MLKLAGMYKYDVIDNLIEIYYNSILKKNEIELLKLSFNKNPKQDELNKLLKNWDIEIKGGAKSLILAYILKNHPDLKFNPYNEPRLKGLLNYYRFHNLKTISHFVKIVKILNQNNITPMIIKGVLMKYLRPDLPRAMGDCDILIQKKDHKKCEKIINSLVDYQKENNKHSIDLHPINSNDSGVDIHKYIDMHTKKEKKFIPILFSRSKEVRAFGINCLIPSMEDLFFIILINLAKNLKNKTSQIGLLYAIFDCKYILDNKPDFNWSIIKENSKLTNTQIQINFAIKFIEKISPDLLPDYIKNNEMFKKEIKDYSNTILYEKFYLEDLRNKCAKIPINKIFDSFENFINYIKLKPKFYLLKMLQGHPLLIETFIKNLNNCKIKEN